MKDKTDHIIFLQRDAIDDGKWDDAIRRSQSPLIYGLSIWLDHLNPGWGGLIYKNYEVVMPLPYKKKYGIRYLAQPPFTQQLGIFSPEPVDESIGRSFIEAAKKYFSFAEIFVNRFTVTDGGSQPYTNYVLDLSTGYETIKKNYTASLLKKSFPRFKRFSYTYEKNSDIPNILSLYRKHVLPRTDLKAVDIQNFERLCRKLLETGNIITRSVLNERRELLACSLLAVDDCRLYNIISVTTTEGKRTEANHFLYDSLIQEFAGQNLVLDFEGSSIPGVAHFYKKFGAVPEIYFFLKWNSLKWPLRIFKK